MRLATFRHFWNLYATEWVKEAEIEIDGKITPVSALCSLKDNYEKILLKRYNTMKKIVKDFYFGTKGNHINRYKRAAIIAYVISSADPLDYKIQVNYGIDDYFLKQRLAFFVAIGSIIQDFDENAIAAVKGPLFDLSELGTKFKKVQSGTESSHPDAEEVNEQDDFQMSIYKDLFFSEIYQNYNVLTMANVFGLLTERVSSLPEYGLKKDERKRCIFKIKCPICESAKSEEVDT